MKTVSKRADALPLPDVPTELAQPRDIEPRFREEDRERGMAEFFRADDAERFRLIEAVVDDPNCDAFSLGHAGGILRCAWDSEPESGGRRLGTYLTALGQEQPHILAELPCLIESYGDAMMSPEERDELASMKFPLTVFRGGVGDPRSVACGSSWTLNRETADFFAFKWPARWGNTQAPVVVSRIVDQHEVAAYFAERKEAEIVVSCFGEFPPIVVS